MNGIVVGSLVVSFLPLCFASVITRNLSRCDTSQYQFTRTGDLTRRTVLRDGDILIQGIFPLSSTRDNCRTILHNGLVSMMAFKFAIDKLDDGFLPVNTSSMFGYQIDDSCNSIPSIMARAIEIVNQYRDKSVCKARFCDGETRSLKPVMAVVGPFQSFTSIPFSSLLGLHNIPIVSPTASSRLLSKKDLYKSFTRIIPSDIVQARVIAEMLDRFNWNYIYVIGSDDNYGKLGTSTLKDYTQEYNFCIVAENYIPYATSKMASKAVEIVSSIAKNSNAKVVVIFAYTIQIELILSEAERRKINRIWLTSDAFSLTGEGAFNVTETQVIGLFKVSPRSEPISGFETFLQKEIRSSPHCNLFLKSFLEQEFRCVFSRTSVFCPNHTSESIAKTFSEFYSSPIGNTIDAANAIATAVKDFYTDNCNYTLQEMRCPSSVQLDANTLTKYLFNASFNLTYGQLFEFDSNGDPKYPSYDIGNAQKVNGKLRIVKVGNWKPGAKLNIDTNRVVWPKWTGDVIPKSKCSVDCPIGYFISARTECCWSCEKCAATSISTTKNAGNCTKCPDGFISSNLRTECIQYTYIALKADDVAGVVIIVINTLGMVFSILIFLGYRYFKRSSSIKSQSNTTPHLLHLSLVQLIVSFAFGEILLMNHSNSYCSIVVGSMYVLRTGFAVLILSRTRLFSSTLEKFVVPVTRTPYHFAHLAVTLVLVFIQIGLTIACGQIDPVLIKTQVLDIETRLALDCSFDYTIFQAAALLVYPNLVLLAATVATLRERSQGRANSDAKFLNFAAVANCILSVAYFPTYKYVVGIYKTILMAFTIDVCAFVYIFCLMLPHLYMAYTDHIRVSSPREDDPMEMSRKEMHRAKYRTSLEEIQENQTSDGVVGMVS